MTYPYLAGIDYESAADGPGIRTTIYLSGCTHRCKGCHNPETHDPLFGQPITDELIQEIAKNILSREYVTGITLSGGDPLCNVERTANFLYRLIEVLGDDADKYSLWIYTGYMWEQCIAMFTNKHIFQILSHTDVMVDGKFSECLADKTLAFRGSSNQRVIDVRESLKAGHLVHWVNSSQEV